MKISRAPIVPGLLLLLLGLALHACAPAPASAPAPRAAPPPAQAVQGPTVEGITEYTLDNGLRVLLFPDPTRQTVTVNVTYLVGSRHERYGETGMAHLLEHLLFKGTPTHPNIPQELTERGARPNGTTWFDRTNYFETFPASDDNLTWALGMEADRMVNSFVRQEDLDSEMTVVRNEWEMGENSPFGVMYKRTFGAAFQWHNYGRSTIGERSDLESVSIERLRDFYRRYYQPDNAILVVAGNFDAQRALELTRQTFGRIPRPERRLEDTYTREPVQDGERTVTVRRTGELNLLTALYRTAPGAHDDFAPTQLAAHVLTDAPSGRMHQALVESGKAARVGGYLFPLREPGALFLNVEVRREQSLDEAREAFLAAVEGLAAQPVTEEELERARAALLRQMQLAYNNSERIALELSEWAAMGDWRLRFLQRDRLRDATLADVNRVAAHYLRRDNRTLGQFIATAEPQRAAIPDLPDIGAMVADYRGEEAVALGEAFDASPDAIEARVRRDRLPGGFQLALLPKQTRGGTVRAEVNVRYGTVDDLHNLTHVGSLTTAMLMRGTQQRTRQQIRDELDRLQAQVNVFGAGNFTRATIETNRDNLPAVLDLVGEVLREPAFPQNEFEQLVTERLAGAEAQMTEPTSLGFVALSQHLAPYPVGHPLRTTSFEEDIANLRAARLDDVRAFHRRFYHAGAGDIAVVGDFDPAAVEEVVRRRFGDWAGGMPFHRAEREYVRVAPTVITIETPDKANAFFGAGINLPVGDEHPDYPALLLGNWMMGGGFLNSRLATRIRQNEGLSYGVGSGFTAYAQDPAGRWTATAIYAPQNLERLEVVFREELDRVLRDGFDQGEMDAARRGLLELRRTGRGEDQQLARTLSDGLIRDRTLAFDAAVDRALEALTVQQVSDAFRRHIDPDALVIVRAGDFAAHR
jgi:zinc protease